MLSRNLFSASVAAGVMDLTISAKPSATGFRWGARSRRVLPSLVPTSRTKPERTGVNSRIAGRTASNAAVSPSPSARATSPSASSRPSAMWPRPPSARLRGPATAVASFPTSVSSPPSPSDTGPKEGARMRSAFERPANMLTRPAPTAGWPTMVPSASASWPANRPMRGSRDSCTPSTIDTMDFKPLLAPSRNSAHPSLAKEKKRVRRT